MQDILTHQPGPRVAPDTGTWMRNGREVLALLSGPHARGELVLIRNPETRAEGWVVLGDCVLKHCLKPGQSGWTFELTGIVRPMGFRAEPPTRPVITREEWTGMPLVVIGRKAPAKRRRKRPATSR